MKKRKSLLLLAMIVGSSLCLRPPFRNGMWEISEVRSDSSEHILCMQALQEKAETRSSPGMYNVRFADETIEDVMTELRIDSDYFILVFPELSTDRTGTDFNRNKRRALGFVKLVSSPKSEQRTYRRILPYDVWIGDWDIHHARKMIVYDSDSLGDGTYNVFVYRFGGDPSVEPDNVTTSDRASIRHPRFSLNGDYLLAIRDEGDKKRLIITPTEGTSKWQWSVVELPRKSKLRRLDLTDFLFCEGETSSQGILWLGDSESWWLAHSLFRPTFLRVLGIVLIVVSAIWYFYPRIDGRLKLSSTENSDLELRS